MNYYVRRSGEVLEHALRERGAERANHKYYARVNVGGRFRYFYTPQELAAYRSGKKVGRAKAEGQASENNRPNRSKNSSAIRVIRKDGSSQSVKPIKTSRAPRDSRDAGLRIVNELFKKRKKKKSTVRVKPISEKPVKKPEQEDVLTVTRSNGKTTSVKPTKAPVKRKRKRKPSLTVTRKNQKGDKT